MEGRLDEEGMGSQRQGTLMVLHRASPGLALRRGAEAQGTDLSKQDAMREKTPDRSLGAQQGLGPC